MVANPEVANPEVANPEVIFSSTSIWTGRRLLLNW
jgi:hypothetical protein